MPKNEDMCRSKVSRQMTAKLTQDEEALKKTEECFRIALKNSPISVAIQDLSLKYIWAFNQKTAKLEAIIGHTDREIFKPKEADRIEKIKERVLKEGVELREQMWLDRPTGKIYLDITWSPVKDVNGKIIGVTSATIDLTELKLAEEALKESGERFKLAEQVAHVGTFDWDVQTGEDKWSPELEALYGLPPGGFAGKIEIWEQLVHPEDKAEVLKRVKDSFKTGDFEDEWRVVWPDGSTHWLYGKAHVFKDSQGKPKKQIGINIDITARKKAEESLKISEEKYRQLLQQAPAAIYEIDFTGPRFLSVNDGMCVMSGFSREELLAKNPNDFLVPESLARFKERIAKAFAGEEINETVEYTAITKEGRELCITLNMKFLSKNGKVFGAQVVAHDITARKKAEEALKASEKKANDLIKYAPSGIYELDYRIPPKFRRVNDAMCQILGYSREELLAKSPFALLDEEGRIRFQERIKKMLSGEKVDETVEFKVIRKDGREIFALMNIQFTYRDGKPDGALVIAHDITERKKAEMALMEWAENLETIVKERTKELELASSYTRSLIEASLDPLVTISIEGKITDVNRATENVTGCTRDELIGSDFSDYFSEPDKARAGYLKVFTEGYVKDYPLSIRHKSGRLTDVLYNATIYRNSQGEIQGVFAAARDITERKLAEQKLKDSERLANIGATAGMVGHDIRNPLQAISSDVFLLKSDLAEMPEGNMKEEVQESLDGIEANVNYINKIVQDLQDYARPLNPNPTEANLKIIIEKIVQKNGIPENIKVSVKIEDEAMKFVVDADYLNRILYNLIANSVQAMPNGGKLSITAYKEAKNIVITVKDTGVGIPKDIQSKMFTPMFTTKAKGQGFGLPVVKRMTESLGGTVMFKSQEGKGTTFTICLPQTFPQKTFSQQKIRLNLSEFSFDRNSIHRR